MRPLARALLWTVLAGAFAASASAQAMRYPVKQMDFDIWCTEVEHIAWERCDKRLPEDMQKFEKYRAIVERYEIPYLQSKENAIHFNDAILHNDPIDKRPDSNLPPPPGSQ